LTNPTTFCKIVPNPAPIESHQKKAHFIPWRRREKPRMRIHHPVQIHRLQTTQAFILEIEIHQIPRIPPLRNQIPTTLMQKARLPCTPHTYHSKCFVGYTRQILIPPRQPRNRQLHSGKNFLFEYLL
jgi:hypothetical protein